MAGVRQKALPSGRFQAWFVDYTGKRTFFVGGHNRSETHRMAQRLEDDHLQIRLGYRPLPDIVNNQQQRSAGEVMDEYLAWGEARGGRDGRPWGKTHLRNRRSQLKWWHGQLNVNTLADFSGILPHVEMALRDLQRGARAPKTIASYAETISAFCIWAVQRGYLKDDPLKELGVMDTTPQSQRRAMTVDEITRLLDVCTPDERLLLETAFLTGLRANELRNLTVEHLNVERSGLHLDASWTKNRKPGFQPLPNFLVGRLEIFGASGEASRLYGRYHRKRTNPNEMPRNPLLYVPSHPARWLDRALKTAGIPKATPAGKIDFHAVRLAYINLVIESGVSVKEAQTLARHATPELTMNVYGRVRDERLWDAVEKVAETIFANDNCAHSVHEQEEVTDGDEDSSLQYNGLDGVDEADTCGFDSRRLHFPRLNKSSTQQRQSPNKTMRLGVLPTRTSLLR